MSRVEEQLGGGLAFGAGSGFYKRTITIRT